MGDRAGDKGERKRSDIPDAFLRWVSIGSSSVCLAAILQILSSVKIDSGLRVALVSFGIALPLGLIAAYAIELNHVDSRQELAIFGATLIAPLGTIVGLFGVLWHLEPSGAIAFDVSTAIAVFLWKDL